jgi:hypothetical protein
MPLIKVSTLNMPTFKLALPEKKNLLSDISFWIWVMQFASLCLMLVYKTCLSD